MLSPDPKPISTTWPCRPSHTLSRNAFVDFIPHRNVDDPGQHSIAIESHRCLLRSIADRRRADCNSHEVQHGRARVCRTGLEMISSDLPPGQRRRISGPPRSTSARGGAFDRPRGDPDGTRLVRPLHERLPGTRAADRSDTHRPVLPIRCAIPACRPRLLGRVARAVRWSGAQPVPVVLVMTNVDVTSLVGRPRKLNPRDPRGANVGVPVDEEGGRQCLAWPSSPKPASA